MNIEDKLLHLRKSMKATTLKDVNVDRERLKQRVLEQSKRKRKWSSKQWMQAGMSSFGAAVLCIFIGFAGFTNINFLSHNGEPGGTTPTVPDADSMDETTDEHIATYLSEDDSRYSVLYLFDGSTDQREEWTETREQLAGDMDQTFIRNNFESFHSGVKERYNLDHAPVALVFNTDEMVFKATEPEQLMNFYEEEIIQTTESQFAVAQIKLGMTREEVVERLGEPTNETTGQQGNQTLAYHDGGAPIMYLTLDDETVITIDARPYNVTSENWQQLLPTNEQQMRDMYGKPDAQTEGSCYESATCQQYKYGELEITFNIPNKGIDRMVYESN
ncbi:hypothetical protein [Thalassobacillus sp. CUG 92003]|uniref:hypothetical protein n=1 Tax=Thalassobacillus sp. CUG 92003 TaxID=2736641 RepID=UPI0015E6AFE5|nr:hypothetical protein [Thalassobacillus sp. CUG 92003]